MASPAAPRLELDRSTSLSSAAMGADKGYDKNKGEDQWPEWPDAQSVGTRAIQFISNHAALEVIVIFAIVINTITLAVQVRPRCPKPARRTLIRCVVTSEPGQPVRLHRPMAQPVLRPAGPCTDYGLHHRDVHPNFRNGAVDRH